jgi:hypothetical protein
MLACQEDTISGFWRPADLQKNMLQNGFLLFDVEPALVPCRWAPRSDIGCENGIPEVG